MKKIQTFMGITTEYDPVIARQRIIKKTEQGLLTGRGLWLGLKTSWYQMTDEDKNEELDNINT